MIRVVLADDHDVVRSGFKALLGADPGIEVVGEAAEGVQAYNLVAREHPDVILLDISMPPGQNGLVACQNIARDFPGTKVVILTMFAEAEYLRYTLDGGAAGYLVKSASADELRQAVKAVARGEVYIHPKMRELAVDAVAEGDGRPGPSVLSARELEILQLLARGYTNKEISERVYLSIKTIESHRAKIYAKLGFKSRSDLVDYAIKHKLMGI